MIDIHSHILFNLDDGAPDIESSIAMANEAYSSGFTDIICTPHFNKFHFGQFPKEEATNKLQLLQQKLQDLNCPIRLHLGNEVYLADSFEDALANNTFFTLANSKYILIEFSMSIEYNMMENIIFSIISSGKIPILAHPERYTYIQDKKKKIYEYVDMGVLLQTNFGSILGMYNSKAKSTIKFLLKEHLVSFIASDAHRPSQIYNNINLAKNKLLKKISNEDFNKITCDNPQKILLNEEFISS